MEEPINNDVLVFVNDDMVLSLTVTTSEGMSFFIGNAACDG